MNHVAIMRKDWKLIPKILSGEKTIESRWYQTKRLPWDRIKAGDTIYFKNSSEPVTASTTVLKVLQCSIQSTFDAQRIIRKFGRDIQIVNPNPRTWDKLPRYCILIFLKEPRRIRKPWHINKSGFGSASAWLTISHISKIKK